MSALLGSHFAPPWPRAQILKAHSLALVLLGFQETVFSVKISMSASLQTAALPMQLVEIHLAATPAIVISAILGMV